MKFTSILKKVILEEQTRFEVLLDNLTKPRKNKDGEKIKPILSKEEFFNLVQGDPTSRMNNVTIDDVQNYSKIKAGSYVKWIIKQYLNPETESSPDSDYYRTEVKIMKDRFFEDLYRLTTNLTKFDRFKNSIPVNFRNINTLGVYELDDLVRKFSLEKTKASKKEKEIAKSTYEHPGGNVDFRGSDWTIVKITDSSKLGQDAACFYGGYHLASDVGETNWCTSTPGYSGNFDNYIRQGPLYEIIPSSWGGMVGEKSGLPSDRYQFHFPSNQFKDKNNRSIDLVEFLNGVGNEIKDYFKPEFAKGLTSSNGREFELTSLTDGVIGKFVSLYGFDDLIDNIPTTITQFKITNNSRDNGLIIKIPENIDKFVNLDTLLFDNCIDKVPNSICNLKKLLLLGLPNNSKLTQIPECIADMPSLFVLNVRDCENLVVPEKIKEVGIFENDIYTFSNLI
jgi:hypothetical protein